MRDAQKPDHISLNALITKLKDGQFVIPDFQRDFEWQPWDIRDLMRSIFLDYYIGGLLLWKGEKKNFSTMACEPIYGYQGDGKPEYIVLDGQQCQFAYENVPANFGNDAPPDFTQNATLDFGQDVPHWMGGKLLQQRNLLDFFI